MRDLVSKETVVPRQWGNETQKFGLRRHARSIEASRVSSEYRATCAYRALSCFSPRLVADWR